MQSIGTTASERYLLKLCHRSFLRPWSFANVYKQPGQELCDLLVVFGDDVIIFSDKSCRFTESGDIKLDWSRWHRRAIDRSVSQVYGAERWLTEQPTRVFVDAACKQALPVSLPVPERRRVHRVVVALGSRDACKRFFQGGSGSLCLRTYHNSLLSEMSTPELDPFTVIQVGAEKYIHVFDDVTLNIVLGELDTTADFIRNLTKKERLSKDVPLLIATGEEELLAVYLRTMNRQKEHDFFERPQRPDGVMFAEGFWDKISEHPQYLAKKKADKISYAWDDLIERYAAGKFNDLRGSIIQTDERALRAMASLTRLERRIISLGVRDLLKHSENDSDRFRFKGSIQGIGSHTAFGFMVFPKPSYYKGDDEYFQLRHLFLTAYCRAMKVKDRNLKHALGDRIWAS